MSKTYIFMLITLCVFDKVYPQCPGTVQTISVGYTTESITPPGYPSPGYIINLDCKWIGTSSVGKSLLIRVTDITLSCAGDAINVYDGTSSSGTSIHINECMSGSSARTLGYKVASSQNVYTAFTSDGVSSASELGFKMYMISADDFSGTGCSSSQTINATSTEQYLSSPSFPNQYSKNTDCTWVINPSPSAAITITIKFMNIEAGSTCQYDYIEIIESGTTGDKLCIDDLWNPTYTYTGAAGNSFTVHFHSDNFQEKQGFLLSYTETASPSSSSNSSLSSNDSDSSSKLSSGEIVGIAVAVGSVIAVIVILVYCNIGKRHPYSSNSVSPRLKTSDHPVLSNKKTPKAVPSKYDETDLTHSITLSDQNGNIPPTFNHIGLNKTQVSTYTSTCLHLPDCKHSIPYKLVLPRNIIENL